MGEFAGSSISPSTFSIFFKPITEGLGWSRSVFSTANSLGLLFEAISGPLIGSLIDRRGGRSVMATGGLLAGVGFIALSLVQSPWHFFLVRGFLLPTGRVGISGWSVRVIISNWFVRLRGRAIGLSVMGLSAGNTILPLFLTLIIPFIGWRASVLIMGALVWVLVVVPAAIFVRRRPEDMGLHPDGAGPLEQNREDDPAPHLFADTQRVIWSRKQALATPFLWIITLATSLEIFELQGLHLHLVPYLTDTGLSATLAAGLISMRAFLTTGGRFVAGFAAERYQPKYCVMAQVFAKALGIGLMIATTRVELIILGLIIYGLGQGGSPIFWEVMLANYFGRLSLGTVRSTTLPVQVLFQAAGPLFAAYVYEQTQSYHLAFLLFAVGLVASGLLILPGQPPRPTATLAIGRPG
ncbi:MAG: MFS transporter [Chloroflexi bacterium]|nr:MFS transporter [Chloroflexota bacterium]